MPEQKLKDLLARVSAEINDIDDADDVDENSQDTAAYRTSRNLKLGATPSNTLLSR